MKQPNSFVISEFTNPSGEIVFRVSGWLEGKRIRKNVASRAEAKAEADALEIKLVQGETGVRPTVTRLTEEELHEAEAIVRRLAGKPRSLSFYVDFALANYREPVCQKSLVEAAAEYVAAKKHEFEQDLISDPYFVRLKREMERVPKRIPVATVAELTSARLVAYFEFGGGSRKTYNNRRGTMCGFLKFALQREWITENPLAKIPAHRIRRRRSGAQTLTVETAKKLMEFRSTEVHTAAHMAKLFISYSHKDEPLRDELEVHLAMLKREGAIEVWHDRRINAGDEFEAAISANLEEADVILLLVSPDFLASRYCYDVEVRRAMERHESGVARVIPVILRPCDWHRTPFAKLLAAPKDSKPITKWPDRDEAFLDVVQQMRVALQGRRSAPNPPAAPLPPAAKPLPRSSNLRLKKEFSEADEDRFKDEAFDHMALFFENSLQELQQRNPGIETRFKKIDAQTFSAAVYRNGKKVARCGIRNSTGRFMGGITFSHDDSAPENSCNESLSVEVGDQALSLRPTFGVSFGRNVNPKAHLTIEGAAEYYWEVFIGALQ